MDQYVHRFISSSVGLIWERKCLKRWLLQYNLYIYIYFTCVSYACVKYFLSKLLTVLLLSRDCIGLYFSAFFRNDVSAFEHACWLRWTTSTARTYQEHLVLSVVCRPWVTQPCSGCGFVVNHLCFHLRRGTSSTRQSPTLHAPTMRRKPRTTLSPNR